MLLGEQNLLSIVIIQMVSICMILTMTCIQSTVIAVDQRGNWDDGSRSSVQIFNAFYDPKYHDDGRCVDCQNQNPSASTISNNLLLKNKKSKPSAVVEGSRIKIYRRHSSSLTTTDPSTTTNRTKTEKYLKDNQKLASNVEEIILTTPPTQPENIKLVAESVESKKNAAKIAKAVKSIIEKVSKGGQNLLQNGKNSEFSWHYSDVNGAKIQFSPYYSQIQQQQQNNAAARHKFTAYYLTPKRKEKAVSIFLEIQNQIGYWRRK